MPGGVRSKTGLGGSTSKREQHETRSQIDTGTRQDAGKRGLFIHLRTGCAGLCRWNFLNDGCVGKPLRGGNEEIEEAELELHNFGDSELIRVGITTEDELNRIRVEHDAIKRAEHQRKEDARDKVEFERLKKKFDA